MRLRNRIIIKAPAERIWQLVADPAHWLRWNPKFISLRRDRAGAVAVGEQFGMVSRLKRRELDSEIIVREVMPLRRVIVRQQFRQGSRIRHVDVSMELTASGPEIQVTQTVDQSASGIPWIFQLLMWLIHRFGRTGIAPLERLKALAERP